MSNCTCGPGKPLCALCRTIAASMGSGGDPDCAICANGGRGTNGTTRICSKCRRASENSEWKTRPANERTGLDTRGGQQSVFDTGERHVSIGERSRFNTPLARAVIQAIARGASVRAAAAIAGCHEQYAKQISSYWNKLTGGMLRNAKGVLATIGAAGTQPEAQ